jgi:hypothetical protein
MSDSKILQEISKARSAFPKATLMGHDVILRNRHDWMVREWNRRINAEETKEKYKDGIPEDVIKDIEDAMGHEELETAAAGTPTLEDFMSRWLYNRKRERDKKRK